VATPVVQQHVASGASGSHVDGKGVFTLGTRLDPISSRARLLAALFFRA